MARRLAAILAADMVGFSRLMAADEGGTIERQKAHRRALIDPKIAQFGGRIVKTTGDGVLVEFPSVVDAVQCAAEIQKAMPEREREVPEDRRIRYRIGINLGDIVIDGDDILGDGVNIAARLEGLSAPGGLCVSDSVHQYLPGKLHFDFTDRGEQQLKNMERPVRVWTWEPDSATAPADQTSGAEPLPLPDRPSIAVLPFTNMSGDPEEDYFADGITEDIITELSRYRSLFVIARNTSFTFRGKAVDLKSISRKLGVRYVVEGSVRRAGKRLRITAQLIDAVEDKHLWAQRYDRDLEDIFALQDEVTLAIVTAIEPQLATSERQRALRKPPESLDAWENYQRGLWHALQYKAEERETALAFLRRAIELDPTFSSAYAGMGYALYAFIILGATDDRERDLADAMEYSKKAIRLDERDPFAWVAISRGHLLRGDHEASIEASDKAISLNPNFALAHFGRAHALWHIGRPEEALPSHETALRLSPYDTLLCPYLASKAIALVMLERYEEAVEVSRESQHHANAAIFSHLAEISALGNLGRIEEAADAISRARVKKPDLSLAYIAETLPIADARCREIFHGGFRKAGLA